MKVLPLFAIAIVFLICILLDLYIFFDIRRYVGKKTIRPISFIHWEFAIIGWCLLIIPIVILRLENDPPVQAVMWMIYAFASLYVSKLIYVLFSIIGRLFKTRKHKKIINYGSITGAILGCIVFFVMWWGALVTRRDIDVKQVVIESPKIPSAFNGYRIVQFSDAHLGSWGNDTTFISRLVNRINSMNPDLIVFTGDIVNSETVEMEPFLNILTRLKAKDGVYSVLGNHDYGDYREWKYPSEKDANNALMQIWQRQIGWKMLNDDFSVIKNGNDSIVLIGVENWGEPPFKQEGHLTDAYRPNGKDGLNDDNFKILLSHNPEHWNREVSKISNIDLTLSGHTHAMQMEMKIGKWKWSPAVWRYPLWGGLYEREAPDGGICRLYVNIGVGEIGIPARIGATPELTEFTLKQSAS